MSLWIPRIAHFYWAGGPLPWLREQALVSFVQHNPNWDVVLGSPETRSVPAGVRLVRDCVSDPRLAPAARSDVWRYHVLAQHGGFYADTDVIFLQSVEPLFEEKKDAWITSDMGTPIPQYGYYRGENGRWISKVGISIGVLAAKKGSVFFTQAAQIASEAPVTPDYQSHGTRLLVAHWRELARRSSFGAIPSDAFYRGSSAHQVKPLWTESGGFRLKEYGLHWYGGSAESLPYQGARSIDDLPDCWVKQALLLPGVEKCERRRPA